MVSSREEYLGSTCSGLTAAAAAVSNGAEIQMAPADARALASVVEEWHARRVLKPLQPGPRCNGAGKLLSCTGSRGLAWEDGGGGASYDAGSEPAARVVGHWPAV